MKKKSYIIIIIILFITLMFFLNSSNKIEENEKIILKRVRNKIIDMHVSLKPIDNNFSKIVFDKYLEFLDPEKRYFKYSDYKEFKKFENKLDDYFKSENLFFYKLTIDRYLERILESENIVQSILKNPIDFYSDDYIIIKEKNKKYAINNQIYIKEWTNFLKHYILREIYTINEKKILNNSSFKNIFFTKKIKNKAIYQVKEMMKEYFRKIKSRKKKDYFSIYLNAFTQTFDPHTLYFSPKEIEEFNSNISGKIIGIGARLQDNKGYPTFVELIVGGPAWKSKKIEIGDRIIKVIEENKKTKNVVGILLEDAIQYIRGEINSKITLVIQKNNGIIKSVTLIRKEIEIDENFIRSAIIKNNKKEKFGIIYIPEFYVDINNPNIGRKCSEDFEKEIIELKKENIKGLIIDLRGNSGGSLQEVVKIIGKFIPNGPILKVKSPLGYEKIYQDEDNSILYDGPLLVLVDQLSASASEIFASTIQDYKRGVILGSKTFGKGTVQSIIPLDPFNLHKNQYGSLKLTIQKFYRINGSSTQIKGVIPDIILPNFYQYSKIAEIYQKNALPWDSISGLKYSTWNKEINYDKIKINSKKRINNNKYIKNIQEKSEWIYSIINEKKIPLQYQKYIENLFIKTKLNKKYEKKLEFKSKISVFHPKYEFLKIKTNLVLKAKRIKWHQHLLKDFYLNEAIYIMDDLR